MLLSLLAHQSSCQHLSPNLTYSTLPASWLPPLPSSPSVLQVAIWAVFLTCKSDHAVLPLKPLQRLPIRLGIKSIFMLMVGRSCRISPVWLTSLSDTSPSSFSSLLTWGSLFRLCTSQPLHLLFPQPEYSPLPKSLHIPCRISLSHPFDQFNCHLLKAAFTIHTVYINTTWVLLCLFIL